MTLPQQLAELAEQIDRIRRARDRANFALETHRAECNVGAAYCFTCRKLVRVYADASRRLSKP